MVCIFYWKRLISKIVMKLLERVFFSIMYKIFIEKHDKGNIVSR